MSLLRASARKKEMLEIVMFTFRLVFLLLPFVGLVVAPLVLFVWGVLWLLQSWLPWAFPLVVFVGFLAFVFYAKALDSAVAARIAKRLFGGLQD